VTTCVFCDRGEQPESLFETEHLVVMPDKFPLVPGHILLVSRSHLACYGAAAPSVVADLDRTAQYVRRFLEAAYGAPVFTWENGVAGQTVFHAHLHLIPVGLAAVPAELTAHPDVTPIPDWDAVRSYFADRGHYHYLELADQRYLLPGHSSALRWVHHHLARTTGLRFTPTGWVKTTGPADVREVGRRWAAWSSDE
jgi:diadenosine tetraphosphate (Ap4A) HIT family hydrolase